MKKNPKRNETSFSAAGEVDPKLRVKPFIATGPLVLLPRGYSHAQLALTLPRNLAGLANGVSIADKCVSQCQYYIGTAVPTGQMNGNVWPAYYGTFQFGISNCGFSVSESKTIAMAGVMAWVCCYGVVGANAANACSAACTAAVAACHQGMDPDSSFAPAGQAAPDPGIAWTCAWAAILGQIAVGNQSLVWQQITNALGTYGFWVN